MDSMLILVLPQKVALLTIYYYATKFPEMASTYTYLWVRLCLRNKNNLRMYVYLCDVILLMMNGTYMVYQNSPKLQSKYPPVNNWNLRDSLTSSQVKLPCFHKAKALSFSRSYPHLHSPHFPLRFSGSDSGKVTICHCRSPSSLKAARSRKLFIYFYLFGKLEVEQNVTLGE